MLLSINIGLALWGALHFLRRQVGRLSRWVADELRALSWIPRPVAAVQHRERQRCLQYAKLAVATRDRHVEGKPPEPPRQFEALAAFIADECGRTGLPLPPSVVRLVDEIEADWADWGKPGEEDDD